MNPPLPTGLPHDSNLPPIRSLDPDHQMHLLENPVDYEDVQRQRSSVKSVTMEDAPPEIDPRFSPNMASQQGEAEFPALPLDARDRYLLFFDVWVCLRGWGGSSGGDWNLLFSCLFSFLLFSLKSLKRRRK